MYPINKRCELRVNSKNSGCHTPYSNVTSIEFLGIFKFARWQVFESTVRDKIFVISAAQRTEATGHTETTKMSAEIGNDESVRQNSYCTYCSL